MDNVNNEKVVTPETIFFDQYGRYPNVHNGKEYEALQNIRLGYSRLSDLEKETVAARSLLCEIDEVLCRLEDFTHGSDGDAITRVRGKINKLYEASK